MTDKILAMTTCETHEDALRIANHLVDRQVAACVNVVPGITSVYRWKGNVEKASEWLLLIKTRAGLIENLKEELRSVHPYEVPELIAFTIVDGAQSYLDWIDGQCMM
jgi:periplasmic divalent cation tolerance protein